MGPETLPKCEKGIFAHAALKDGKVCVRSGPWEDRVILAGQVFELSGRGRLKSIPSGGDPGNAPGRG
jgi:hypothetical protein